MQSNKKDPQLLLEARGYLQEALEIRKDWAPPAVLTGKICEMQDDPDQALDFYIRAIYHMNERDSDVIRRTVQLLVPRGRVGEAKQLFDYLEKKKSPLLGEMNQEHLYVEVFTDPNIARAEQAVEKSVAEGSKDYKEIMRQGQMYGFLAQRLKLKAQEAGREWKTDGEMIRVAQLAVNSLLKARSLNPQSDDVWTSLVRILVEIGQPDKARPLIDAAEASLGGDDAAITLAACCEVLGETERAQAKYEVAAKAAPQNSRVLRKVAGFYLRSGKYEAAETLLRRIIALQTPTTLTDACWARRSLALVLKSHGDFDHFCEGLALIDENLHGKAASPEDKHVKVAFLIADPRRDKVNEAVQAMEDLVKGADATPEDSFTLAKLYLRKNDWDNYQKQMHGVLGAGKGAMQPHHLVFYISSLLEKKDLDDADNWLKALEKIAPHYFDTVRLRSDYLFLRGDYKAAEDLALAFALYPDPHAEPSNHGQQLLLVAQIMETFCDRLKAAGKDVLAEEFGAKADMLFTSQRSKKVSAMGDIYFASYLARQKRVRECLELLQQCVDKYPAENLRTPATVLIHSNAANVEQYGQLEKVLLAASSRSDHPMILLPLLADLHAQQRQYEKSIADYRQIIAKEPRNYKAMNNLGVGLARAGQNLDEALPCSTTPWPSADRWPRCSTRGQSSISPAKSPIEPWKTSLRPSATAAPPSSISTRPGPSTWRARKARPPRPSLRR